MVDLTFIHLVQNVQGGADDTAGKQVGLLKLISASVLVLTGRAEQKVVRWHREKCLRASSAKSAV